MKKCGLINDETAKIIKRVFFNKGPKEVNAVESRLSSLEQPKNDQSSNKHHMPDSASQVLVLKQAPKDISDIL